MNVSRTDRLWAFEFYNKHPTGAQAAWIEAGDEVREYERDSVDDDVKSLAELLARARVDGGINTLRESYAKMETQLRKAEARAENAERKAERAEHLELILAQAVTMLKESQLGQLAGTIEQRVQAMGPA